MATTQKNKAPDITVQSGDSAAGAGSETNSALLFNGVLTVRDADVSDTVTISVQGVALSGTKGALTAANALAWFNVPLVPLAADRGDPSIGACRGFSH